jgi:amino acid adenylation domain-containing protein
LTVTDVLDVYEMTPLQAGMLFHSLYAPADTSYFEQYWCTLEGPLDIARFKAAWQAVIARHAVLRSECQWDGFDAPVQVVYDDVDPEWTFADWSGLSEAEEEAAFERWRVGDRQRGFRMDEAPLLRFALLRLGPQRCRFVWSFHHLLMDGWCGALLVREVFLHYGGNTLPAPPPPYRNYVDWRASQDMAAAEHYWRSCLDGIGVPAPIGIARVSTGERGVAELRETLPAGLYLGLKDMARRERLTVNTLLQGAWSLLLSRYGGGDDVAFGAVLSGRPPDLSGVEQMIGLFLNTVPIRVDTNPQQPLIPWLQALQAEQRQRETFGYAALPDIQRWAGLEGGQALFDSLLIVETYPQSIADVVAVEDGAITVRDLKNYERTHYPVTLKILPGSQMELALVFDTAHITETAAQRLLRHFATVLQAFVRHPFAQLGEIEIVDEAEIRELIALGKGPTAPLADPVHVQFLAQAQARPDAMAVEYVGESGYRDMRYRDLDAASAGIAAALQAQGVAKGDVVALCLDRGPDLIAALLGILRAGAVYLPVDPDYPAERLAYVIGDSGTALALVDRRGREALGDIPGLVMVNLGDCMAGKPGAVLKPVPVGQDDLAYILYTSGSTGRPKGVPIRHGSLANFLQSMAREPGLCARDRLLALTTISFDIAALELFGPLVVGATVVIGDALLARDGYRIAATLDARDISVLQATPAGWRLLIESGWSGQASLKMLCGGEALDGVLARELARRGGALWNLYGPTETAIWSAAIKLGGELLTGGAIPVGGPIDRTSLLVLDARGRPVPRGIAGELHIGGAGLSPGYHQRPDLTKAAFVECTVPGEEEGVLYRTGDQVRYRDDGLLEFLGRLDGQVKLRGFRIELGEIEARLSDHPLVAEAVAMVRDDGTGPRLVAYLRSNAATATVDGLRQHLAATLPAYMVPGAFVFLDRFPLTPNGKVDRRALPMPGLNSAPAEGAATLTRELVGNIWADILGTETVEPDANFFALGGHSLLATRVIGQVKRATGVELNLRDLFEAPVLSAFCQRIDAARGLPQRSEIVPADKALAPCLSFAQQRQWVMAQIDPGSSAYLMPAAVRLSGELDLAVMEEALSDIVARHEILRTSFPAFEGEPTLRVAPVTAVSLPFEDLSALPEPERQTVLTAARRQEATLGFDLDLHSPWRARLLRLSQDEHVLLFTLHHILADEWSLDILLKDLAASYAALRRGRDTPIAAALAYTDFAAWQRSLSFDREREYWCQQLAGAPVVTPLPTDFRRPEQRNGGAASQPVRLSMETVSGLRRLGLETGSTLFMCLLAAFKVLIYRHTDHGDILVGTPVANRQQPEVQGLVGLFANTVVIRSDLSDNPPFDLLLARLRDTVLAAHAHQDMPFEQVLDAVNVPRSDSHAPLVQCFFSLETLPRETEIGGGLHLQALPPVLTASARFDLSLVLNEGAGGLSGNLIYAVDMFTPETARALCERFQILLDGLVAAADRRLSELPLLRDEERSELDRWARGDKLPDRPGTVHGSFCAWAHSTPDAIAIQSPLGQLTYRQLYRRVMSISAQLRDHGINRGDAVGVAMEGEVGTVASILGVFSLGAVCVPLDAEPSGQNLVDLPVGSILAGVLSAQPLPSASSLPWIPTAETVAVIDGGAADPPVSVGLDEAAFILAGVGAALPAGLAISHLNVHALSRLIDVASGDVLEHGGVACSSADILALMAPLMTGGALLLTSGKRGWPEDIVSSGQARRNAVWLDHATLATLESGMGRHSSGATRIVASAALGAANTDLLRAAAPEAEILLVSGPAEAPATLVRRLGALDKEARSVVGQPAPGSLAYVLDGNGQIVPPGVPGVLYIGGAGVAVGYLGQAAVTAERFSPNPFIHPRDCAPGHEVLHRTFQRARWRHDGVLEWLGETDHQQAISVSRLAPRPHALSRSQAELTGTAPDGDLERMLAQVWCETLGLATVGRSDNFFDLGGDSILAMRLVHRASRLGLVIEPRDIFRHQTIAGLANVAKWSERTDDVEVKAFALVATDAVDLDAVAASVSFGDL